MLQQYTPIYMLTPDELRELNMRASTLMEGQKAIILSTGRAVLATECKIVAQNKPQALFG